MATKKTNAATVAAAQIAASFDLATAAGTAAFVDHYVKVEAAFKALEAQIDALKDVVKKDGRDVLLGTEQLLDVNLFEQSKFDGATAKTFLTPTQIALCTKKNDAYRITVKERPDLEVVADLLVNAVGNGVVADEAAGIKASDVRVWGSHAS